jgi:hypothetical protein
LLVLFAGDLDGRRGSVILSDVSFNQVDAAFFLVILTHVPFLFVLLSPTIDMIIQLIVILAWVPVGFRMTLRKNFLLFIAHVWRLRFKPSVFVRLGEDPPRVSDNVSSFEVNYLLMPPNFSVGEQVLGASICDALDQ